MWISRVEPDPTGQTGHNAIDSGAIFRYPGDVDGSSFVQRGWPDGIRLLDDSIECTGYGDNSWVWS